MVGSAMSLTGNGFKDWWLQRISAVVVAAFAIFLFLYIVINPHMSFATWQHLFACSWMKVATITTVLAILMHSWIGIWTVTTDYCKNLIVRIVIQWTVVFLLLAEFIYVIMVLWGRF